MKQEKITEILVVLEKSKKTIRSLKLSILAHPDCTCGSEFEDYTNLAQNTEDEITSLIKKNNIMEIEAIDERNILGIRAMFNIPETSDIVPLSEEYCKVGQEVFRLRYDAFFERAEIRKIDDSKYGPVRTEEDRDYGNYQKNGKIFEDDYYSSVFVEIPNVREPELKIGDTVWLDTFNDNDWFESIFVKYGSGSTIICVAVFDYEDFKNGNSFKTFQTGENYKWSRTNPKNHRSEKPKVK